MDQLAPLRSQRGLMSKVASALGKTRGAIAQWDRVPAELVPQVEAITGIPRYELRPDLWDAPATELPRSTGAAA